MATLGVRPALAKASMQGGWAGEAERVGDERIGGQGAEGELAGAGQRMVARDDDGAMPAVAGQERQIGEQALGAGGDGAVDAIVGDHLGDLLGGALVQVQAHIRVLGHGTRG